MIIMISRQLKRSSATHIGILVTVVDMYQYSSNHILSFLRQVSSVLISEPPSLVEVSHLVGVMSLVSMRLAFQRCHLLPLVSLAQVYDLSSSLAADALTYEFLRGSVKPKACWIVTACHGLAAVTDASE
jgi:hypothetical protein